MGKEKCVKRTIKDDNGNSIIIENKTGTINIYISLKGENKRRKVGSVNEKSRTIKIKRNRGRHLFRKNNSYGFNYYILSTATKFDFVHLKDDFLECKIPVSTILKIGSFLHFKNSGFEKQIFLSLSEIESWDVKNKNPPPNTNTEEQLTLF